MTWHGMAMAMAMAMANLCNGQSLQRRLAVLCGNRGLAVLLRWSWWGSGGPPGQPGGGGPADGRTMFVHCIVYSIV